MNPGVQFVIDKCENQLAVSEGADEVSDKIAGFKNSFFWFWLSVVLLCNCLEIAVCCDGHPSVCKGCCRWSMESVAVLLWC